MKYAGIFNVSYEQDMAIVRTRLQWALLVLLVLLLLTPPIWLGRGWLTWVNVTATTVIAVMGLQILTGYCGQISLGQSALVGTGAYVTGFVTTNLGLSFWLALPAAVVGACLLGLVAGLPALRLKGFYLAMSSLALQFIFVFMVLHLPKDIFGSVWGLEVPPPRLGSIVFDSESSVYYLTMFFTVLAVWGAKNLVRTRVGRAFVAIRDNDLAAAVMGIDVVRYKLTAFIVASMYAGLAGSLWSVEQSWIHVDQFNLWASIWYLGMLIVGGMGSITGAIFGTLFIKLLEELGNIAGPLIGGQATGFLSIFALMSILIGVLIAVFLVFEPKGLFHRWELIKAWYRLWPFSY